MAVTLETQHRVDEVFEHPWPGEVTLLGDVADEHHRQVAALGLVHEELRTRPHLGD